MRSAFYYLLIGLCLILPKIVFAQTSLRSLANTYYNQAVLIAFPLAVIVLIYGGYLYITSTGNPETLGEAKGLITGAIIGLILLLLAGLLVRTIGIQTPVT